MLIELYIFSFVIVAYGTFTTLALVGIGKLKRHIPIYKEKSSLFISIIISARNEEKSIERCLDQICKQTYSQNLFELILIDDASEDRTFEIAKNHLEQSQLHYQLIKQPEHRGKKYNIAQGISLAKGSVIITSDADVVFSFSTRLTVIANYFNLYSPNMLVMPVDFESDKKLISAFQIVENIALTAVTAGYTGIQKPFMCNGANLAFKKNAYMQVNGYDSHAHMSSGEDVFLMEDMKKINPSAIHYFFSRELIVKTIPQANITSLFSQRLRWASKTKYNSSTLNRFSALIVLLSNLLLFALFVAILKKSFIIPYLSIFVVAKFVFDFLLLFLASDFLGRIKYIWWLPLFECIYWIYAFSIGAASFFINPTWKGKKIN